MKKILVTGMTKNLGGVEKFIISYIKEIIDDDIKIDFMMTDEKCALDEEIEKLGAKKYILKQRHSKHPFKFKREFEEAVKKENYDAIWVNDCSLNSFHYIKLAKKCKIPTRIIHSHNSQNMDKSFKGRLKYLVHLINKLQVSKYATNYWACSQVAAQFFYIPKLLQKVEIINNGIDIEKFKFSEEIRRKYRKELNLQEDYVLGHVGRFHFQKNHIYLLEIFKKYLERDKNAKLLLIGDGEDREKVQEYILQNNLEDNVILLGIRDDVQNIMQAMDVFMLPSLFEGLPIVGIEAQGTGLPCIFSDKITKETKVTEQVDFLPIGEEDISKWVDKLENIKTIKIDRSKAEEDIKQAGYDIKEEANKIKNFFRS